MRRVLTYGTYDLLHWGHVHLLQRARSLGSYLTVGLSTDEFNQAKGKTSYFRFQHRRMILESIRYVDQVIEENCWDQKVHDIRENKIDVFVMGDDWKGKFDFLQEYCEVVYLPRTPGISTTDIRKELAKR